MKHTEHIESCRVYHDLYGIVNIITPLQTLSVTNNDGVTEIKAKSASSHFAYFYVVLEIYSSMKISVFISLVSFSPEY